MTKEHFNLKIIIRAPNYPVIVVTDNELFSAFNIKQLAEICFLFDPIDHDHELIVIDSTGYEFKFESELTALMPDFLSKKWTKKMIIELFNENLDAKELATEYSMKSISNKRTSQIIGEICELLSI